MVRFGRDGGWVEGEWEDGLAEYAVLWLDCVSSVAEAGYPVYYAGR